MGTWNCSCISIILFIHFLQLVKMLPRNWKDLKCQKTIGCGDRCWSVATKGDLLALGCAKEVRLYSKTSNELLHKIACEGKLGDGLFSVAFLDEQTIVVSDYDKYNLKIVSTKGELIRTIDRGSTNFEPQGVTVSPDGHIYVCDEANDCVCVFDVEGKSLFSFGSRGSDDECFNCPGCISFASDGLLYITDVRNHRICVYDKDGKFVKKFPTNCKPSGVVATDCGHLVVTSSSTNRILVFTTEGDLVHEFGERGEALGQFCGICGLALDSDGAIYIVDNGNRRIQVF